MFNQIKYFSMFNIHKDLMRKIMQDKNIYSNNFYSKLIKIPLILLNIVSNGTKSFNLKLPLKLKVLIFKSHIKNFILIFKSYYF